MKTLVHITTVPLSLSFVANQIPFMQDRGFDVHAISSPGRYLNDLERELDVTTWTIGMSRNITPGRDLRAQAQLIDRIRRIRPDIVHAHTPKAGLLGMVAATACQVPVRLYHMRGLLISTAQGRRRALLAAAETTSCHLAHRVICQSESLRNLAIAEQLVEPWASTVLASGGNGVDSAHFDPVRWESAGVETRGLLCIPEDALVVGFVGRLVGDKGVNELAQAWQKVRERFENAHMVVVGPFEDRDPIDPRTRRLLEHDERVHLIGFTRDTARYYATMDVLALPTYREGFPNVPMEAASMAIPVVATRVVGCIDAVEDGITGTLIPARDPWALELALSAYLESPARRERHGQAARQRVLAEFQPERVTRALYELYQDELARAGH